MARPAKAGCPYFPLDCNFYDDKRVRLLRARFGAKVEAVLIRLWCQIYSDNGYYTEMRDDDIALLAESMGGGYSPAYIRDVVLACCERGLFDGHILAVCGVLTGAGIQKRYLQIRRSKKCIPIIREYWVLPDSFFKGEDEALKLKLQFFSVLDSKTPVLYDKTPVLYDKTQQRKVQESKEKKRKGKSAAAAPAALADGDTGNGDGQASKAVKAGGRQGQAAKAKKPKAADVGYNGDFDGAFGEFITAGGYSAGVATDLEDFAKMRVEIGKPMTAIAAKRLCAQLEKLADEAGVRDREGYIRSCLGASILHSWQGVFAAKDFADTPDVVAVGGVDKPRSIAAGADITEFL